MCIHTPKHEHQDVPCQLPAVGSHDISATPLTPHSQVHWQACHKYYQAWWWIPGRWCCRWSQEVVGCAKGYHLGMWDITVLRTYELTSTQSWHDAHIHDPELFRSSTVGNGWLSHPGSNMPSLPLYAPHGPPWIQSWPSVNHLPSTNYEFRNRLDDDMGVDIHKRNQDDDAGYRSEDGNKCRNLSVGMGNGNHDDDGSIDYCNG